MSRSFSAEEVARALRAQVTPVVDEVFPVALAQVARTAPVPAPPRRLSRSLKVAALASSILISVFGAAQASSRWFAPPEPTQRPSEQPVEDRIDPPPGVDAPQRRSEGGDRQHGSVSDSGPSRGGANTSDDAEADAPAEDVEPDPATSVGDSETPEGGQDHEGTGDGAGDGDGADDGAEDDDSADDSTDAEEPVDDDAPETEDAPDDTADRADDGADEPVDETAVDD